MKKMVAGLVETRESAQNIADDLTEKGFDADDIGFVTRDEKNEFAAERTAIGRFEKGAKGGLAVGGAGGVLGAAATVASFAVAGAAPIVVIGSGPVMAALAVVAAGGGALVGGVIGTLTDAGLAEKDARFFADGVKEGDILVTVWAQADRSEQAREIMERHNAVTQWDEKTMERDIPEEKAEE